MPPVLTMPKFWKRQISRYGRVLNMRALHSVLNMPKYAFIEFWILSWLQICQNSEYGRVLNMQELHRVLNRSQYVWICLKRTWISLNMSEFTIMDRVLNIYHIIHSVRSLYKLMSAYWETGVFGKIFIVFNYYSKKHDLNFLRRLWICVCF